jgi:hypothetical protein
MRALGLPECASQWILLPLAGAHGFPDHSRPHHEPYYQPDRVAHHEPYYEPYYQPDRVAHHESYYQP